MAAGFRFRTRAAPSLNAGHDTLSIKPRSIPAQFPSWECPLSFSAFLSFHFGFLQQQEGETRWTCCGWSQVWSPTLDTARSELDWCRGGTAGQQTITNLSYSAATHSGCIAASYPYCVVRSILGLRGIFRSRYF